MPLRRNKIPPAPPRMTWGKAAPVIAGAIVFDLLRAFFAMFWFFGPALAALYCGAELSDKLSSWTFGIFGIKTAALVCGVGVGVIAAKISAVTIPFGIVMATAMALLGFLTLGFWLIVTNARLFKTAATAPLHFAGAFAVGSMPLVGAVPAFTFTLWRLYGAQIKTEQAAFKKWEAETAALRREERQMQLAYLAQAQAAQAANDERYNPQEMREAA